MPTQPTIAMIPSGYGLEKIYSVLPTNGDADLQFSRGSVATRVDKSGLISNVQSNFPRLDYLDSTCPSLLLEPQRTNLIPNSQDIITGWSTIRVTVQNNQTISPDGFLNASLSTSNSESGTHASFDTLNSVVTAGSNYFISCFVKKSTTRYVRLNEGYVNDVVTFDLNTQTFVILQGSPTDIIFEDYGNGWYRIGYKFIAHSSGNTQFVLYINDNNNGINYAGNGEAVYLWGVQIEQGSYPTSYMPTTGTSVTRNAETAFKTGVDAYINNSEGVFYLEISRLNQGQTGSSIWSLSNGSNSNAVSMYYANSGIVVDIFSSSGVKILNYGMSFLEQANFNKLIIKYKSNDIALWVNGLKVAVNTNAISLSGLNQINASYGGGEFPFLGKIKDLRVYNTALTDLELETLSSFTTFNAMALNFNYTIY